MQDHKREALLNRLELLLRSEAAPAGCMDISELDGLLTGIAVGPRTVPESVWLPHALGAPGRVAPTSRLAIQLVSAIRDRYAMIVATVRDDPESLLPVLLKGPNGSIVASSWCEGFMEAVNLSPGAWNPLMEDAEQGFLLMPILSLCRDEAGKTLAERDMASPKGMLNQLARMIPAAVEGIYGYWNGRRGDTAALVPVATIRKAAEPGRNDPCPCGSGKKYKRCCYGSAPAPANVVAAEQELSLHRVGTHGEPSHAASGAAIPNGKPQSPPAASFRWVPAGQTWEVQGIRIDRGMVYSGSAPRTSVSNLVRNLGIGGLTTASQLKSQSSEPSMIDPTLPVRPWKKDKPDHLPYELSYLNLLPAQRSRYLRWLATGAKDTSIDPGYAHLYLFGLERRLLVDTADRPAEETAAVMAELDRLAASYGGLSHLGDRIRRLKDFLQLRDGKPNEEIWNPSSSDIEAGNVPLAFRYTLGVYARDRRPLPAAMALLLALLDRNISKRTAVGRCPEVFAGAFAGAYTELYGEGLLLARTKARLDTSYYSVSPALRAQRFHIVWDDLPDVLAVAGPRKKLSAAVELATERIDSYSRFVARYPERAGSLVAVLLLPVSCWPEKRRERLLALRETAPQQAEPLSFEQWLQRIEPEFNDAASLTAGTLTGFAKALASVQIGIEPDLLSGARKPAPSDAFVLFPLSSPAQAEQPNRALREYRTASTSVALLCAVLNAGGGNPSGDGEAYLGRLAGWASLHPDLRARLFAQYRLQLRNPVRLTSLKSQIADLTQEERAAIATLLSLAALAGGAPSLAKVKLLEQIYAALQLDDRLVYTHLHGAAEQRSEPDAGPKRGRHSHAALDPAKIAHLQRETAAVSALLANVFAEEEISAPPTPPPAPVVAIESPLPGLDAAHAAFASRVLARPRWQRTELAGLAAELRLMLDGAIERVNDASLDLSGEILLEGDDEIDVHLEVLEGITG